MKQRTKGQAKPQPVAISKPEPAELPDWLTSTPMELEYSLAVKHPNHDFDEAEVQEVRITRAEYIALKLHLAQLRGIEVGAETEKELTEEAA